MRHGRIDRNIILENLVRDGRVLASARVSASLCGDLAASKIPALPLPVTGRIGAGTQAKSIACAGPGPLVRGRSKGNCRYWVGVSPVGRPCVMYPPAAKLRRSVLSM